MKKLRLIINPYTGTMKIQRQLCQVLELFSSARYETIIYFTQCKGDGTVYTREHAEDSDLVVCCGGDGTLNEVVSGILDLPADKRPPVGYIPAGTCNDFASSLGIPTDVMKAADRAVRGKPTRLDVGRFGNRLFLYIASCGAFTEASYNTPQAAKNSMGHLAYVLQGIGSIKDIKPFRASFRVGDKIYEDDYVFCSVSNSTSIAGIVKLDETLVNLSDGLFEITLVKTPKNIPEILSIVNAIKDKNLNSPMIQLIHAPSAEFSGEGMIAWTIDGEYEPGGQGICIENLPGAMEIML
ncbi:MAG: YegS/Rv2252/BmrU family lipid kinase [Clostridia bacterium]|nr:YegS/Rv2252/BmrU family lipid kinase [Clostridia bacterium]MBQ4622957.1 YegS/Rv2252/BmrU family lipid kinase [Clostridia bacterium]